ncbi:hypothetical protein [Bacillus multifaciens]|uniref:hypothetical protein n=1 Tax=Bacillus multifaciens TaxID=3068506 RepID=UPI0027406BE8|nr:hypothetical protein [Bacillus sp. WLY-B-L8]MDP7981444.1 hypothetical protein [Bacillus sp. WLY-B-L8]
MGKYPGLISLFWFVIYTMLTCFFVSLFIEVGGKFDEEIKGLSQFIDRVSPKTIILIISVLMTLLGTVVAYIIAKFLLLFFVTDTKSNMSDMLIPKSLVMIVNILIITLLNLYNPSVFILTSFIGSIGILLLFQAKKKNWKVSIVFSLPFIVDASLSLAKTVASLF